MKRKETMKPCPEHVYAFVDGCPCCEVHKQCLRTATTGEETVLLQRVVGRRRSKRESLQWATEQLEQMAKEETDPKLRALWLHSAARGYELGAKPANDQAQAADEAKRQ